MNLNSSRTPAGVASLALLILAISGCGSGDPDQVGADPQTPVVVATHLRPIRAPGRVGPVEGPVSRFDLDDPQIANLDRDLLAAVQDAAAAAGADGIELRITSGWRSRAHQQRLLDEAVKKYGSLTEALRWVSAPDRSAHVAGDAVDVGPTQADSWLSQHGSAYGLCQIFANEIWHFELATGAGGTCPALLPDSSYR